MTETHLFFFFSGGAFAAVIPFSEEIPDVWFLLRLFN